MKIGSLSWCDRVGRGATALGVTLTPEMIAQLAGHGELLLQWNRRFNLTAITAPDEVAVKHFVDALAPVCLLAGKARLLDIGAGGGFPGIPLKIALPDLDVTLIEASRKKVSFMQHVIRHLALDGICARHARAEAMAEEQDAAGAFDAVVSRALSDLGRFFRWAAPFLAPGGIAVALKGKIEPREMARARAAADALSLPLTVQKYTLPFQGAQRSLVCLGRGGNSISTVLAGIGQAKF